MNEFIFLLNQFVGLILTFWYVSVFFLFWMGLGLYKNRLILKKKVVNIGGYTVISIVIDALMILVVVIGEVKIPQGAISSISEANLSNLAYTLFIFEILIGAIFVFKAIGYRFFAIGLALYNVLLGLICLSLTLMAITGSWM